MWYVYIIRSQSNPSQRYIGMTGDISSRLDDHNAGHSPHTAKYRPWRLEILVGFSDKAKALAFEGYLKSGSGFAFARRHF